MIYLDTSVALAVLFDEPRKPYLDFWDHELVSSLLLQYELHVRLSARGLGPAALSAAHRLIAGITLVDLDQPALARALQPFPLAVRTLDGIHLATMEFLRVQGLDIEVATYDRRLAEAAEAMGFKLANV